MSSVTNLVLLSKIFTVAPVTAADYGSQAKVRQRIAAWKANKPKTDRPLYPKVAQNSLKVARNYRPQAFQVHVHLP